MGFKLELADPKGDAVNSPSSAHLPRQGPEAGLPRPPLDCDGEVVGAQAEAVVSPSPLSFLVSRSCFSWARIGQEERAIAEIQFQPTH